MSLIQVLLLFQFKFYLHVAYVLQVLVFVISWTPYTVMATWDTLDKAGAQNIPGAVQAMAKQRLDMNF